MDGRIGHKNNVVTGMLTLPVLLITFICSCLYSMESVVDIWILLQFMILSGTEMNLEKIQLVKRSFSFLFCIIFMLFPICFSGLIFTRKIRTHRRP